VTLPAAGTRAFVLVPSVNSPGKKDVTGAFGPEARNFVSALGLTAAVRAFDNTQPMDGRRAEVSTALDHCKGAELPVFAFFCHGWKDGVQFGWRTPQVDDLAARLVAAGTPDMRVILYACDAGRDANNTRADDRQAGPGGQGGFADLLWHALVKAGAARAEVYAHSTEGHTSTNPYVRAWRPGEDGVWLVEPHSQLWRPWVALLRTTQFRYRFPFLSREGLEAALLQFKPRG
jgi:hypothetical protein